MMKDKDGKDKEKIIKFLLNIIYIFDGLNLEILCNVFGFFLCRFLKVLLKFG